MLTVFDRRTLTKNRPGGSTMSSTERKASSPLFMTSTVSKKVSAFPIISSVVELHDDDEGKAYREME